MLYTVTVVVDEGFEPVKYKLNEIHSINWSDGWLTLTSHGGWDPGGDDGAAKGRELEARFPIENIYSYVSEEEPDE